MAESDSLGLDALRRRRGRRRRTTNRALHELQCFIGDPVGSVNAAIAANPGFVMAHVLKGYLYGLSTDREAKPSRAPATMRRFGLPGDRRASAAMSPHSAISPRGAGTRRAACWKT